MLMIDQKQDELILVSGLAYFRSVSFDLVLCLRQLKEKDLARAYAKTMLRLWPDDNMGFRYLLQ